MRMPRELSCWFGAAVMAVAATPLSATGNDADAGSWQMIVLTGPTQFTVAAPAPVNDPGYLAELASIKTGQGQLTTDQQKAIDYWSKGGVLRWNEILGELVARADLPPEPNPDGTYPVPDANNPFAFPQFPFSNPPYAARAYSYISVAQYEALKVAWYYKYLYNRPSPSKLDSGIKALLPNNDLPAYPSEDAVLSAVTAEILKLLFPASIEEITLKAGEQRQVALLSGKASASDIAAGLALGQAVAAVFNTRAGSDGMKAAGGTAAQWQALADAAVARGEIPWKSQDIPARPPMLPFFGNVKGWMMTPADIVTERPGPPPSTRSTQMATELAEVKNAIDNLTRDQLAIVYKWADGASTLTPPGHWDFIAEPYISNAQFSEVRAARALALLNMALHDAAIGCWDAKYFYFNPRPTQLDPRIKTAIPIPNFPSYTSGHSTFSAAADAVLSYLFPSGTAYFDAQKDEAAISRLYGAIHYRSDIEVGKVHGTRIGGYTVRFAQHDGADHVAGLVSVVNGETLNYASFRAPVAPGSIAAVFETGLGATSNRAAAYPLPTSLGGVSMRFNGSIPAPLFSAAPDQATIQIPWELEGLSSAALTATHADGSSTTFSVPLAAFAPAILSTNHNGTGQGAVTIANTGTIVAAPGSIEGETTRAAARGEFISIYCVGLGPVNNPPATGAATPDASSTTISPVSVLLNGASVPADFAGLSPGLVGLFVVNVKIPDDAPTGDAVSLALSVGGVTSNTVTIAVQ
ncbi:MAG: phosphatase PAP2 family protein [Acidobacteriia bacterium]|nr:phosphatase PAP2 family protein [Terriglobia bacterium]